MQNSMFLLVLWFLLAISAVILFFFVKSFFPAKGKTRRRYARIRVPNEKMITCRITEPRSLAGETEYMVNDINVAGIAFSADKIIEKTMLKLSIRFPFTDFNEASSVWGRVVYCNKIGDSQKYRVGICYIRQKRRGK